ncbi:MAG: ferrous iron transport protein B [Bacteroidota bacterium]|nr:ferrous iron transport protein B [Bacteroidota bacterium]
MHKKRLKVALVGNPNSGKSTIFNQLTGLKQKIANFPGVTVEKKTGFCSIPSGNGTVDTLVEITDLPGTYSLYPKTIEEQIPFQVLCDPANESHPDITVIIADGTNLKRSLFLSTQVVDLKSPAILVVNMMDLVNRNGVEFDFKALSEKLGIPVIPMNALEGGSLNELKKTILSKISIPEKDFIDSAQFAPEVVEKIKNSVKINSNYAAFQIANNLDGIGYFNNRPERKQKIREILKDHEFSPHKLQAAETLKRYKVISELLKEVTHSKDAAPSRDKKLTRKLDNIFMHRFWGYLIFLVVMFVIFQSVFAWASYPMDLVDQAFSWMSTQVHDAIPEGMFNDLLVEGILAGLAGVVIFIPQIALLFFFIALLEDTGYMARVSFMMDKLLRRFGLNGRSVVPLISGVACAVPAILATRTIASWKDRLITILVTPLMSCAARLPVYALLISMVIPDITWFGLFNLQGLVLMGLYLIGFLAAIGSAVVLKWIIKARERSYFIMEIPLYRMPRWKNVGLTIVEKVKIFVFDAGKIIVAISVVLWVLSSFGPGERFREVNNRIEQVGDSNPKLSNELAAERLRFSYAGITGRAIEPVIEPLGFDWKIGIALITSFAAREVFVGTMSTIYSVGGDGSDVTTVKAKMLAEKNPDTGLPRYTLAVGMSLMLFYAFAMQCMSTLAIVKRETGSWKWAIFQFVFMGTLAYISSFVIYRILS